MVWLGCSGVGKIKGREGESMVAALLVTLAVLGGQPTVGHEILKLEVEVGATADDGLVFDCLIEQAKKELVAPKKPNREDVKVFLTKMRDLVISSGFREAETPLEEPSLLCQALREKVFDCDTLSFILISMAEELKFPLRGATAPGHMFVIWTGKKEVLLWDSRSGEECEFAKAHEFMHLKVPLLSPYNLKPLSHKEVVACGWYNVAAILLVEKGDYQRALEITHEVMRDNRNFLLAQVLRGHCFQGLGNIKQAENDFQRVLKKDPNCVPAWCALSQFYSAQSDLNGAIEAISKAISIAPSDADLYLWRGIKYQERGKQGDEELAAADFGQVLQLDPVFLIGRLKKKN